MSLGNYVISVCTGGICLLLGGDDLLECAEGALRMGGCGAASSALIRLEKSDCMGMCGNAPCVTINNLVLADTSPPRLGDLMSRMMRAIAAERGEYKD
jgi:NADH:ubiquinone oxidoreductase subunit E